MFFVGGLSEQHLTKTIKSGAEVIHGPSCVRCRARLHSDAAHPHWKPTFWIWVAYEFDMSYVILYPIVWDVCVWWTHQYASLNWKSFPFHKRGKKRQPQQQQQQQHSIWPHVWNVFWIEILCPEYKSILVSASYPRARGCVCVFVCDAHVYKMKDRKKTWNKKNKTQPSEDIRNP